MKNRDPGESAVMSRLCILTILMRRMHTRFGIQLAILFLILIQAPPSNFSQRRPDADLLLINARVITMNSTQPSAEAIADSRRAYQVDRDQRRSATSFC